MKAILVIDMPNTCEDCPCMNWASYEDEILCGVLGEELFVNDKEEVIKSKRCPLKPMPEPKYAKATDTTLHWGECYGWNACIKAMRGEDE